MSLNNTLSHTDIHVARSMTRITGGLWYTQQGGVAIWWYIYSLDMYVSHEHVQQDTENSLCVFAWSLSLKNIDVPLWHVCLSIICMSLNTIYISRYIFTWHVCFSRIRITGQPNLQICVRSRYISPSYIDVSQRNARLTMIGRTCMFLNNACNRRADISNSVRTCRACLSII